MNDRLSVRFLVPLFAFAACSRPPLELARTEPVVHGDRVILDADGSHSEAFPVACIAAGEAPPLRCNGRLVWDEDVTARVFSPVAGRIAKVEVAPGQHVTAGQPLVALVSPEFSEARATFQRATAEQRLAERTIARLTDLQRLGAVANREVLAAEADLAKARADVDCARARLAALGASDDSSETTFVLRAPLDGIVVERNVNPGQEVRPDQMLAGIPQVAAPLFTISDPTRLAILIDATEREAERIGADDSLTVNVPSDPAHRCNGRIAFVADSVDPTTRMVRIRGTVQNTERWLKAEMYVTADIRVNNESRLQAPANAVFLAGERHYVFVQDAPGSFQRRQVEVGAANGDRLAVLGVREGEHVVVSGCTLLEQIYQGRD